MIKDFVFSGDDPSQVWRKEAKCGGMDPNIFFPYRGGDSSQARAICRQCPVGNECLEESLRLGEKNGVWGGKSGHERKRLKKL